jgi:hypothetical protein
VKIKSFIPAEILRKRGEKAGIHEEIKEQKIREAKARRNEQNRQPIMIVLILNLCVSAPLRETSL